MEADTTRMSRSKKCFEVSIAPPPEDSHKFLPYELRDFCNKMPLDSVETLLVEYENDDEKLGEDIARLLASHLPGVRSLAAQEETMKYILQVMHPQADGSGPGFPLLRELEVYDEHSSSEVQQQLLISLADCLVARKESGKAADMEELEFAHRIIPPDYLQDLEHASDKVALDQALRTLNLYSSRVVRLPSSSALDW
ncbi:hypothetical protein EWM64_g1547 [Hericium alpestre]|uniref:Uncharacterized protein n=1 Tax=Hericium alpestre TaxID=135208 RepID=A0A4Z0A638_9AGAM|nr:hypothetical protein EWM64_g1547 [Hericium alpestre]